MRASSWWRSSWSGSATDLGDEALHPVEELAEETIVDRFGHPPRDCSASFWRIRARFSSSRPASPDGVLSSSAW